MGKKVIIAGSRTFNDFKFLNCQCEFFLYGNAYEYERKAWDCVLCGMAEGADTLGERFAKEHNIPIEYHPAEWEKYGKKAGIIRNIDMGNKGDILIAFWDGESRGTEHMIEYALEKGLEVHVFNFRSKK